MASRKTTYRSKPASLRAELKREEAELRRDLSRGVALAHVVLSSFDIEESERAFSEMLALKQRHGEKWLPCMSKPGKKWGDV